MKKYISILIASALMFSCGEPSTESTTLSKKSGGTVKMNLLNDVNTLFPPYVVNFTTMTVTSQLYEGLVKMNPDGTKVVPAVAEKWEVNDDFTVFTFTLRKDVYFHETDNFKSRLVTANDIKDCYTNLCTLDNLNNYSRYFSKRIKKDENGEVTGIKIIDDQTIEITLNDSYSTFHKFLTAASFAIYPPELTEQLTTNQFAFTVGTGPFKIKTVNDGSKIELVRHEKYWKKDIEGFPLPYLEGVNFSFLSKEDEIKLFTEKGLDLIKDIPVNQLNNLLPDLDEAIAGNNADFNYYRTPGLDIKLINFNHRDPLFKNLNLRKSFNYAIDRGKLVDSILLGDKNVAGGGLLPQTEIFGNINKTAFPYNPTKAKEYLAKAGYPNGVGLPEITVHTIKRTYDSTYYTEVVKMINLTLGTNLKVDATKSLNELTDIYSKPDHKMQMWRHGWIADYADAENFLQLYYDENNPSGYNNPTFNKLFDQAVSEKNENIRKGLYLKTDQVLIDDAAIIPLLNNDIEYLTSKPLKGFTINPLDYRDLREVYFEKKEK